MRSLIIIEVEHGEDTDALTNVAETIGDLFPDDVSVIDYTVKVDLPACFVLDSPTWYHEDGTVCEAGPADGADGWCDAHDRDIRQNTI